MIRLSRRSVCSALAVADGVPLPTEFLIFKPGINRTGKGDYIFNADAAARVLSKYKLQGVDYIVDREHDSLSEEARVARSDAGDALAHYQLELRADGSLWAVGVVWNADGESDLREKKRRYTSPAFNYDLDTREIDELINIGLVSMPATYSNAPLIAARRGKQLRGARVRLGVGSMQEISDAVCSALNAMYPTNDDSPYGSVYVCDLYDDKAVFNKDGLLYSIAYTYANGTAALSGAPLQVVRTYTPAAEAIQLRADRLIAQVKKDRAHANRSRPR